MAKRTLKRRRRENKTDYKLRLNLLKSGTPRIVIRRTNKYFVAQIVESDEAQDKIIAGVNSKDLLKNGWDAKMAGSLKSIPAGYLTGLLLAKKVGKGSFIMDLGMARTLPKSRVFAVIKGLIDGGLDIPANKKSFPTEERLGGEHMKPELKEMIIKVKGGLLK
jgi:large subunit ribosomal protein L18